METRCFELRYAEDSRELSGITMRYGVKTKLPFGEEMFMPGAFGDLSQSDVILNRQHQRIVPLARTGGGGLILDDNERRFMVRAELPNTTDANDTLELVRKKILRGLSVEFDAIEERWESRVRIIDRAILYGVGVVDRPAYVDAVVQARALGLETLDMIVQRERSNRRKRTWL